MNSDDKILKILDKVVGKLDGLQSDVSHLKGYISHLRTGQDALKAGIEDLQAKQEETKVELKAEMQAGFQALRGELGKSIKSHERHIEELEEGQGVHRRNKN